MQIIDKLKIIKRVKNISYLSCLNKSTTDLMLLVLIYILFEVWHGLYRAVSVLRSYEFVPQDDAIYSLQVSVEVLVEWLTFYLQRFKN